MLSLSEIVKKFEELERTVEKLKSAMETVKDPALRQQCESALQLAENQMSTLEFRCTKQ